MMKRTLDWREVLIINFFKKNGLIILLVGLIFGVGVAFGYDKLNSATYESSGQLVQNDNNSGIVSSYKQFLASNLFSTNLKKKINQSTWKDYDKKNTYSLALTYDYNSPFFVIKATSSNAKYSQYLTNTAQNVFIGSVGNYLAGSNISIVSHGSKATKVISMTRLVSVGVLVFLIVCILMSAILLRHTVRSGVIKNENEISDIFGLKNLGLVGLNMTKKE
ncbi:hypothetical protein [Lactiplantibacillus plantarum]|uniref:hypothetical protein n=2 Tax=Lactiplantibacillus plantarum TaxID=1590 RepID=UPI001081B1BE|nr:hypothetical protein [Lactiplantibacillus plantarum]MDN7061337.1 hypothetical protein [Lactiplantibacillus plantarum]